MGVQSTNTYVCDRCAKSAGPYTSTPPGWANLNGVGFGAPPAEGMSPHMVTAGALLCDGCTTALDAFLNIPTFKLSPPPAA